MSGLSSDLRDVEEAAAKGNARAKLALDILCYTIKKYIAAYAAAMGGVDAIVFTAVLVRTAILSVLRPQVDSDLWVLKWMPRKIRREAKRPLSAPMIPRSGDGCPDK